MRYRLMATYRGAPFEAGIGPSERDVMLFAACPPPEDLRFEPATGHWRKQLRIEEVQALRESRPVGVFRGERCMVLDDLGDRLHIAYLGHDAYLAESLGYWQVDRGVFELITPRDEVSDIIEARRDFNYPARRNSEPGVLPGAGSGSRPGIGPMPRPASGSLPAPGLGQLPDQLGAGPVSSREHTRPSATPAGASPAPVYLHEPAGSGVLLPPAENVPLPLEAAALRAAARSASSRGLPQAPERWQRPEQPEIPAAAPRRQRAARRRQPTELMFAELAGLAAIPASSYAIGAEVDGALCLLQTDEGFEVFSAGAGTRHEARRFAEEESAYFYLFGVLAAEAVRTGVLVPHG